MRGGELIDVHAPAPILDVWKRCAAVPAETLPKVL